jgi:GDP-4-dehydro-6-deoxy-D-mannose reductase
MTRSLITGVNGFSGSYLAEYLLSQNHTVFGTIRGSCRRTEFIKDVINNITLLEGELTDINSIGYSIRDSSPDYVFHLGAQTFVPNSWRAPIETMNSNVIGTVNLLETIRKSELDPKILMIGSSEEYGMVYPEETPIKETNPLRPLSPYGVSKVAQDLLGYQYHESYGLKVVRLRPFNLIGPRSGRDIVSSSFANQIVNIENKLSECICVGDLKPIRDFNDVRDVCKAYLLAINKCEYGEVYNISTGIGIPIQELLDRLLDMSTCKSIKVTLDANRRRPSDVMTLIGDSSKFRDRTGWKPELSLDDSLRDLLKYTRNHYSKELMYGEEPKLYSNFKEELLDMEF